MPGFAPRDPRAAWLERADTSGGSDACWPWQGTVSPNGYGVISVAGRGMLGAHVLAVELDGRPRPPRAHVHHLCINKLCVNPRHLEVLSVHDHAQVHAQGKTAV